MLTLLHFLPTLPTLGMLLTMADTSCGGLLAGHAGMTVYGPPGLNTLVNAFRTFVNVKDIGLQVRVHAKGKPSSLWLLLCHADWNNGLSSRASTAAAMQTSTAQPS